MRDLHAEAQSSALRPSRNGSEDEPRVRLSEQTTILRSRAPRNGRGAPRPTRRGDRAAPRCDHAVVERQFHRGSGKANSHRARSHLSSHTGESSEHPTGAKDASADQEHEPPYLGGRPGHDGGCSHDAVGLALGQLSAPLSPSRRLSESFFRHSGEWGSFFPLRAASLRPASSRLLLVRGLAPRQCERFASTSRLCRSTTLPSAP